MDREYFDLLLPKLAQLNGGLDLFYEIKSNVTKAQVKALKDAGVGHIQPGIESLSDQVLAVMRKGVKGIQNLQLLKWCMEYAVEVDWNLLWGFPGEAPAEYQKMARLIPFICHLQPPSRGTCIRLDRFSPNFTSSAELGFSNVRPYEACSDVYEGARPEAVFNLSYFFRADGVGDDRVKEYTRELSDALDEWRASRVQNGLTYLEVGDRVVIVDSRSMLRGRTTYALDALRSRVFLSCDAARSFSGICREFPDASPAQLAEILEEFREQGTMWFDGRQYLSLAVSLTTFLQSRESAGLSDAIDGVLSDETGLAGEAGRKNDAMAGAV